MKSNIHHIASARKAVVAWVRAVVCAALAVLLVFSTVGCNRVHQNPTPPPETVISPNPDTRFVSLPGTPLPDGAFVEEATEDTPEPEQESGSGETTPGSTGNEVLPQVDIVEDTAPLASTESSPGSLPPGSSSSNSGSATGTPINPYTPHSDYYNEEYAGSLENDVRFTRENPFSTFSVDVDTASYSNVRRMINNGSRANAIPRDAVRIEEFLNYFSYDFIRPQADTPFAMNAQIADCPWNPESRLMILGLQAQELQELSYQGSNFVFLIDVSGSMSSEDKLPLLKESFSFLTENLTAQDTVSIVTYASGVRTVLDGARGDDTTRILGALQELEANGSTYGEGGLTQAYSLAEDHFIHGGNNRIIMASDGDLNVGISSTGDLNTFVSSKRETGIYLSVLGFGTGNYKDAKMETLADNGNGNYHYIDGLEEAQKVLGEDLHANSVSIADDVKLQIEFNPTYIQSYRLIGYENRSLNYEDFTDDSKDAAEMGAGHQVIVAYEIVMADTEGGIASEDVEEGLASEDAEEDTALDSEEQALGFATDEWLSISLRYKEPMASESTGTQFVLNSAAYTDSPDKDWRFAASVIEFGFILSQSSYAGSSTLESARELAEQSASDNSYRQEYLTLLAQLISAG